jgi:hypothetical protein
MVHPRTVTRGGTRAVRTDARPEVLVHAPEPYIQRWILDELVDTDPMVQVARTTREVITALLRDETPRPRVLILQVDGIPASELLSMRILREEAWTGTIIVVGHHGVPHPLKLELQIEHVVRSPFAENQLRKLVTTLLPAGSESIYRQQTVKIDSIG